MSIQHLITASLILINFFICAEAQDIYPVDITAQLLPGKCSFQYNIPDLDPRIYSAHDKKVQIYSGLDGYIYVLNQLSGRITIWNPSNNSQKVVSTPGGNRYIKYVDDYFGVKIKVTDLEYSISIDKYRRFIIKH